MPQVSVIIPTYNRSVVLPMAIDSVLNQTYKDFEIIVVDDGSSDNTREVVAGYASRHAQIRYVWQENKKQAAARNFGIQLAKGEYIAFLDSDDTWMSTKLGQQVVILNQEASVGMVYCNQLLAVDNGDPGRLRYKQGWLSSGNVFKDLLRRRFYCSTQTVLVRRAVLDQVGFFDEHFANALEDWELTLRIAYHCQVVCVDEPLVWRLENVNYPREYSLTRAENHRAILEKTFSQCSISHKEKNRLWKSAWFTWGLSFLESQYYLKSIVCFTRALGRGHRFALPALLLGGMGPLGRWVYTLLHRHLKFI